MGASFATHVLFLLWFFAATFSLSLFKAESNISCIEKEKQALLIFKKGLSDPRNALSSWSDQVDCCRWDRVHCNNKTGRVTELHLSGFYYDDKSLLSGDYEKRLGGEISLSLLKLEFLNYLDLSYNNFNCTPIPSFLGSIGSLRYLDLSGANFSGLIPHQLGNLSSLRYLSLGSNSDLYVDNLRWMSHFSSIQYLDLNSIDLHREVDWLQIMSKFSSLLELHLSTCQLDSLKPSLGFVNHTSLQVLDLSYNLFNHEIPNCFFNLSTSLVVLKLEYSLLKGKIPPSILNLHNLEYLLLSSNDLVGKIPESIGQLKYLKYLDLWYNSLSGPIPSSIGNFSYLEGLSLSDNQLSGTIPESLGLLSNLEWLSIDKNLLTGTVGEGHFTELSKLTSLYLSNPLFFNVSSNWIPPFQLDVAYMSYCKVGPNFPTWLQTQKSLRVIRMSKSEISDEVPGWFWNWTSNIEVIDLSGNHIEGDMSDAVLNSTVLNLNSNHFKGRMPQLSANVKELNIADNSFAGPISTFLCLKRNRMNKLIILDASFNLLSGELPDCWKDWQSLARLDLGSNSISGGIPHSMGSLVALQTLHLENNNISGDIPSSLQSCSQLELLDIGENHLQVTIPLWIGEMTSLMVLRLRSNGLHGHIPLQICQLSSIIVLDLANNSLSGTIPKCLNNLSALAKPDNGGSIHFGYLPYAYSMYVENLFLVPKKKQLEYFDNVKFVRLIDLSSNNLSESIPVEISVLFGLHFLNLSQNHLTGAIPEKIGSMKELESIDLSRNHLSGEIPPSMSNLTFLSQLDLSYNSLSGRIPLSTQLQSFDALSYTGNPQLCGDPLPKTCTVEEEPSNRTPIGRIEDHSEKYSFYIGLGVGFAVGFWAICGVLFFKRTWRHAYFRFLDGIKDWVYVTTMVKVNWFLEKLRSCHLISERHR
ncbi:receptor-like protein EIX2 isoform X1 [Quercus lobata]|uniref:Leucine-rich repeat-containing N-terminal plant-type domain-containing protein n=1 Tax=Quercus lobata TaxID=97700 RepID=A0A7N2LKT3_QUELO|nr:receptor-like protein EIX2 isoform X1 [Quercus lobata]